MRRAARWRRSTIGDLLPELRALFPEIAEVSLVPEVGSLDDTLARVAVQP